MAANSQAPRGNPLEQLIGDHLIKHLSTTIVEHGKKPVYSCGGHIPIGSFKSVIVRWDTVEEDAVSKPFLVVSKLHLPSTEDDLQRLINACQPATFGHHHEEIMDLDYRTAGKMDAEDFSTNFHLSAFGILDTIKQILRPGAASSKKLHSNGIRAELCKLNVHSAPAGKFRAHVDTPRGKGFFGFLVVCLPSEHEGGQLVVRHLGTSTTFDWGDIDNSIHWAAFYSDVENEVLEVTKGHRITLTYNLFDFVAKQPAPNSLFSLDPVQLPLHATIKALFAQAGSLKQGYNLGIYCSHVYAHTHASAIRCLVRSLKGIDMAVYKIFRILGFKVIVRPILDSEPDDMMYEDWNEHDEDYDDNPDRDDGGDFSIVGRKNLPLQKGRDLYYEEAPRSELFPGQLKKIRWLNKTAHPELAMTYTAYGNTSSSSSYEYSHLALIVEIPPYRERKLQSASAESAAVMQQLLHEATMAAAADNDHVANEAVSQFAQVEEDVETAEKYLQEDMDPGGEELDLGS